MDTMMFGISSSQEMNILAKYARKKIKFYIHIILSIAAKVGLTELTISSRFVLIVILAKLTNLLAFSLNG